MPLQLTIGRRTCCTSDVYIRAFRAIYMIRYRNTIYMYITNDQDDYLPCSWREAVLNSNVNKSRQLQFENEVYRLTTEIDASWRNGNLYIVNIFYGSRDCEIFEMSHIWRKCIFNIVFIWSVCVKNLFFFFKSTQIRWYESEFPVLLCKNFFF